VRRAAEIAFHSRQYEIALDAVGLWLSLEPDSPSARQMQSTLLLSSGRIDELAASLARDLARAAPNTGEALLRLVRAFTRYPDRLAVHRLFEQLTQPYLDLAEARFVRAQAELGIGDTARAGSEIDQALALRPNWDVAALFKAELLPKGRGPARVSENLAGANPGAQDVRLAYARSAGRRKALRGRARRVPPPARSQSRQPRHALRRRDTLAAGQRRQPKPNSNSSAMSKSAAAT
jgi:tetratricopeptide (TPR) repeat protein